MRGLRSLLAAAACCVPGIPACAAASLQCTLQPPRPVLGHAVHWEIRARDLPPIPMLSAPRLGGDWLLQRQGSERSGDAAGHSTQTLRLVLYPLASGALSLPAVRAGSLGCPQRRVRIADSEPGQAPLYLAAHALAARPVVGQALRVDLDIGAGGALDWRPVRTGSDDGVLRAVSTVSTEVQVGGRRIAVQRQSWSYTPTRAGTATIRFGLLRATPFGKLRVYRVAPLRMQVAGLPAYWPADAAVGRARLRIEPAPRRLDVGAAGVLRASLSGAQIGRAELLRLLARSARRVDPALRMDPPRVSLDPASAHALAAVWDIEWPFRVLRGGAARYPRLRVPYYDPLRGAPQLAVADWGALRVHDPRPLRLLEACALVGGAVLLLALLRAGVLAARAGLVRARWHRIARRGDARALLHAWHEAAARGDPRTRTLRGWVDAQRGAWAASQQPAIERLVADCERQWYARPTPRATRARVPQQAQPGNP